MVGTKELNIEDILGILRRRVWWIVVPAIVLPIAAYLFSGTLPYRYTSTTMVLVEQQKVPDAFVKSTVTELLNTRLATMQEQILSRTRLQPILERFGLFKDEVGKVPMEDLVDRLRRNIQVVPIQANLGLGFTISFTAENPRLAQQVCSEILSMFIGENIKAREQISQGTTDFLSNQLDDAKRKLDEMDGKLAEFKQKYMGQLPGQEGGNIQMINTLNSQLEATTQQIGRTQQDRTFLSSLLAQQESTWKQQLQQKNQGKPAATPNDLENQITALQGQLSALESKYTSEHPDVVKTKHQLVELQAKLETANKAATSAAANPSEPAPDTSSVPPPKELVQMRLQLKMLDDTIKNKTAEQQRLQGAVRGFEAKLQLAPAVEEQYKSLTRDHDTALLFYNQLLSKKSESEMATDLEKRQQGEQFKVMDPPNLPERPTFPNRPMFASGGGVFGLALGLGLAFLLEYRQRVVRSERDVEYFLQLPTLVCVPWVGASAREEITQDPPKWKIWKRKKAQKPEAPVEHDLVGV